MIFEIFEIFVIFVIFMLVIGAPWKILEDGGGDDGEGLLVQLLAYDTIIRAPVRRYISTIGDGHQIAKLLY